MVSTQKKRRRRKQSRPMKPACLQAEKDLDTIQAEAFRIGIDVRVSYPGLPGQRKTLHVMFDYDGKRLVDFWPATGRTRIFDQDEDDTGSFQEAFETARDGMIRFVHGVPQLEESDADTMEEDPEPVQDNDDIMMQFRDLLAAVNAVQDKLLVSRSVLATECAAILGRALEKADAPF